MCALGDCLINRPKDCSQSRELWFFDIITKKLLFEYTDIAVMVSEWKAPENYPRYN